MAWCCGKEEYSRRKPSGSLTCFLMLAKRASIHTVRVPDRKVSMPSPGRWRSGSDVRCSWQAAARVAIILLQTRPLRRLCVCTNVNPDEFRRVSLEPFLDEDPSQ